jgi:hypothetical protein
MLKRVVHVGTDMLQRFNVTHLLSRNTYNFYRPIYFYTDTSPQ